MVEAYPQSVLEQQKQLLALLGGFWSGVYVGTNTPTGLVFARAQDELQAITDLNETAACQDRFAVPLHHDDHWYALRLIAEELVSRVPRYGDGFIYGPQTDRSLIRYGVAVPADQLQADLPSGLVQIPLIFDTVGASPKLAWAQGIDYAVEAGKIVFFTNPFEYPDLTKDTDGSLTLWCRHARWDRNYIGLHFGNVAGLPRRTSDVFYRRIVNALWDAYTTGSSQRCLQDLLAAIVGEPVVAANGEVVERLITEADRQFIVTDAQVYSLPRSATLRSEIVVGAELEARDLLTQTVQIYNLNSGEYPADVGGVTIGPEMLGGSYLGGLTFRNIETTYTLTYDDNGVAKATFPVEGFADDIQRFWAEVHRRGVTDGRTLARLLDSRGADSPVQPTSGSLPSRVNPLQFLAQNVLRNNAFIVRLSVLADATNLRLNDARLSDRLHPPWTHLFLLFELPTITDNVTTSNPGYSESAALVGALPVAEDTPTTSDAAETVTLQYSREICD